MKLEHLQSLTALAEAKNPAIKVIKKDDGHLKNFHEVRANGRLLGSVWQDEFGWSAEYSKTGASWDSMSSKEDAVSQLTDEADITIKEAKNHMGESEYSTYAGWKRACKKQDSTVWFDGDEDIAQAMVGPKPYKRGETKSIGEWDGAVGSVYLKESAEYAKKLVRGEKSAPGIMNKIDAWFSRAMFTKDKNRFLPAHSALKQLKLAGFSEDQIYKIRDAATVACNAAVERMQTKHGDRVPDKYIAKQATSFGVFDLFLNVSGEIHDEYAALMRKLFDAKLDKIKDELVIVKEDANLQSLGKALKSKPAEIEEPEEAEEKTDVNTPPEVEEPIEAEEAPEAQFKVGDKVKPTKGPHKGEVHTVVKVVDTNGEFTYDIKPDGLEGEAVKYAKGGANAKPEQLELAEGLKLKPGQSLLIAVNEASPDRDGIMPLSYRSNGPARGKHKIEAYGRKGMKNTMWRKTFKDEDALEKWCEDNDATCEGTREIKDGE